MNSKSHTISRFLLPYLLTLIPVLAVSFFVSGSTLYSLKQTTADNITTQVSKVCTELNELCISYTGSAYALTAETYLEGMFWTNNGQRYQAISAIKTARSYDMTAEEIFLYCGDGYMYSSSGLVRQDIYLSEKLKLTENSITQVSSLLKEKISDVTVIPLLTDGIRNGGYLLLHYRVPANIAGDNFSVNFLINFNELAGILAPVAAVCPVSIQISFANGTEIYFSGDQDNIRLEDAPIFKEASYTSLQADAAAIGAVMEIRYLSDLLYKDVYGNQLLSYVVIALGLLASTILSLWFSKRRVNSFRKLEAAVSGSPVEFKRGEEFAFVGNMLRRWVGEANSLSASIESYRSLLRQQTMQMLSNGLIRERKAVNQLLESCGIELVEDFFFIGGITMDAPEETFTKILNLLSGDLVCENVLCGSRGLIFLLELPNSDVDRSMRTETALRLKEVLSGSGARNIRIGMSQVYQELFMAEIACQEVIELLEKPSISNNPACFEQIMSPRNQVSRLNQEALREFAESIEKSEPAAADHWLCQLNQSINSAHCTESNRAYLRYCVLQTMLSALGETNDRLLQDAVRLDMNDGISFVTELRRLLHKYCSEPSVRVNFSDILNYIHSHYNDYNLSAAEVAEYAGIDKSHLSRYFKSNIHMSYIDYLTHLRLEKARELLENTDLPITEIVSRVGYSDHSSFRRKFKAVYGYSVSDCRGGKFSDLPD